MNELGDASPGRGEPARSTDRPDRPDDGARSDSGPAARGHGGSQSGDTDNGQADPGQTGPVSILPATFNRAIILVGFAVYAVALYFAIRRWELPTFSTRAFEFLALALGAELGAKWFFGELFRDALARQGRVVTTKAGIYAALVGSAVARLLPAGGALTPSAMAWAVRAENDEAAGAALRTAVVSYGGLLVMTGIALGWGASTGRHPLLFTGAVLAGVLAVTAGLVVLVGTRWLKRIIGVLPERLRRHFGPTAGGGSITAKQAVLVWARISMEAGVLWAGLWAFGIELTASQTMVAFGISTVVGGLPATPGGVGLVEGGLVGVLVGFGFSAGAVIAPVLVYRIIDYWVAAALGLLAASRMTRHVAAGRR